MTPSRFTTSYTKPPTASRPKIGGSQPHFFHNLIRDSFPIQTWLAFGAVLQTLLFIIPGIRRVYAILPVTLLLVYQLTNTLLATWNVTHMSTMDNVLQTRYCAVFPDDEGNFSRGIGEKEGDSPSGEGVCVFILGFRCNHPLGIIAPGFAKIFQYMQDMFKDLEANAATNGYLGHTVYFNAGHGTTTSEIHSTYYFRSTADVHNFANGPSHRKGWDWYAKVTKQYPWLAIMHELYWSEAGAWENVYANWAPSGLADTSHKFTDGEGNMKWMSPIADAKGRLKTSAGRLGMTK